MQLTFEQVNSDFMLASYRAIDRAGNSSTPTTSSVTVAKAAPGLSTPSLSPTRPTHGKWFTVSGRIATSDPTAKTMTFTIQRKVSGKWKAYTTVNATLGAGKTTYSARKRLSKAGSYRVRGSHAADSRHLAGVSSWKAFTVK